MCAMITDRSFEIPDSRAAIGFPPARAAAARAPSGEEAPRQATATTSATRKINRQYAEDGVRAEVLQALVDKRRPSACPTSGTARPASTVIVAKRHDEAVDPGEHDEHPVQQAGQ